MSLFLLTTPEGDGADRGGRGAPPTAWWLQPIGWIDERLAELERSDPAVDFIRLGQDEPEGSTSWAELYSLDITPRVRATADGDSDQVALSLVVTCMAGQAEMLADPMASVRLAGLVWSLLDEYGRTEVVATGPGAARKVALYLGRARIEEQSGGSSRAIRMPAVVVDAGRITSKPAPAS